MPRPLLVEPSCSAVVTPTCGASAVECGVARRVGGCVLLCRVLAPFAAHSCALGRPSIPGPICGDVVGSAIGWAMRCCAGGADRFVARFAGPVGSGCRSATLWSPPGGVRGGRVRARWSALPARAPVGAPHHRGPPTWVSHRRGCWPGRRRVAARWGGRRRGRYPARPASAPLGGAAGPLVASARRAGPRASARPRAPFLGAGRSPRVVGARARRPRARARRAAHGAGAPRPTSHGAAPGGLAAPRPGARSPSAVVRPRPPAAALAPGLAIARREVSRGYRSSAGRPARRPR